MGVPYVAAAKLKLGSTSQSPGYSIERIFDDPPAANDNHAPAQLREVEVDDTGNVYVLNCHYLNSSDILWTYRPDGQLVARQELQDLDVNAPAGLCVSSHDPSKLYIASSQNPPDASTVKLYVLSSQDLSLSKTIDVRNMGHITDIAEDPATGTLCVVGFHMPVIPSQTQLQNVSILSQRPFYQARFAVIPADGSGPVQAVCPSDVSTANDMALPLSVICIEGVIHGPGEAQ